MTAEARYPIVLFDLDHTLFDFEASKRATFTEIMASLGRDDASSLLPELSRVERPLWRGLEAGELTLDTLNRRRFADFVEATDIDADSEALAVAYLAGLGRNGGLLPGARSLLDQLGDSHQLALVSNGYSEVQRARLENFDLGDYFDAVVISSEIGVAKPDTRFFDETLRQLGDPDRSDILMVGDSLTSDIDGGIAAGLDTCWFNPTAAAPPVDRSITHVVTSLDEIGTIV